MSNTHTAEPGMLAETEKRRQCEKKKFVLVCVHPVSASVPVWWRGEETQDDVSSLHVDDVACGV